MSFLPLPRKLVGLSLIVITIALIFVCLFPFGFSPKNRAYWTSDGNGIFFDGHRILWKLSMGGAAYIPSIQGARQIPEAEKGAFSISIHLMPGKNYHDVETCILALEKKRGKDSLDILQWNRSLILHWFSPGAETKGKSRTIGVDDILHEGTDLLLTIASDQTGTTVFVDGESVKQFPDIVLLSKGSSIGDFSAVLGNSADVQLPWIGTIYSLAFYEQSFRKTSLSGDLNRSESVTQNPDQEGLIAAFNFEGGEGRRFLSPSGNALEIPEHLAFKKIILRWPHIHFTIGSLIGIDQIANIFGYFFFGFFLILWLQRINGWDQKRVYLIVVLTGGFLSLALEFTQAFIPARDSSLFDLLCNIGGLILSIIAFQIFRTSKWIPSKFRLSV